MRADIARGTRTVWEIPNPAAQVRGRAAGVRKGWGRGSLVVPADQQTAGRRAADGPARAQFERRVERTGPLDAQR